MVSNACAFDKALSLRDFGLVRTRSPGIRITTHVEVIMVNVDDFYTLVVFERIWNRPSVDRAFFEVHGALVVCMVQLSEADQGDESWIVDVVGDLFFHDPYFVPLLLMQEWNTTADWASTLQSVDHFVVARWIDSSDRSPTSDRAENRNPSIPLVDMELNFLAILHVWRDRNRNPKRPKTHI
jgi:hypothetical protein